MVTVRKLISELKKMPQTLQVGVALHDNGEHEVAAWVSSVLVDTDDGFKSGMWCNLPSGITGKKCVILRC